MAGLVARGGGWCGGCDEESGVLRGVGYYVGRLEVEFVRWWLELGVCLQLMELLMK